MCNTSPGTVWIGVEREGKVRGVGRDPLQSGGLLGQPCFKLIPWTVYAFNETHNRYTIFIDGDNDAGEKWKEKEP